MGVALRVARYRFRATLRHRLGGYLALVVFVGLIGGLAFGSLIAARRTEASYPQYLATTNPSALIVQPNTAVRCRSPFVAAIGRLPHVREVRCATALDAETLTPDRSIGTILLTQVELVASSDGMFSSQDKVTIANGRSANPDRANEVVASPTAARLFHLHVGSRLLVGVDTANEPPLGRPYRDLELHIVGIGVFGNQVVQDDIDRGHTGFLLGTPALAAEFAGCCTDLTYDGLQLSSGARDDSVVEHEYAALVERSASAGGQQLQVYETSVIEADAERAIRPEAVALAVFGAIAAVATLIIGAQVISRRLRDQTVEVDVLWALGADRRTVAFDELVGLVAATVVGALLAGVIGIALSPLAVFGPVRSVEASPGIDFDWTVVGLGIAVIVLLLSAVALGTAYRLAPRGSTANRRGTEHGGSVVGAGLAAGLSASAAMGLRFALQGGRGRSAVPVRSAIVGAVLAVCVVTATLTFGDSLDTLASQPALYGWNFDSALYSTDGYGPIPSSVVDPLLARDRSVASATGVYFANFNVEGQPVPSIGAPTGGAWSPPILSGHRVEAANQVVLGPATLVALHKRIGDIITAAAAGLTLHLQIVGTATLPTIGTTLGLHATIGSGAVFSTAAVPASVLQAYGPISGPNAIFVRYRAGVNRGAATRSLDHVVQELTAVTRAPKFVAESEGNSAGLAFERLDEQRPAEIVNYRSMGSTPGVLAAGLAAGAVAALGLTLIASVRRRRRELALLKTLGFTRRQLLGSIAWQATVVAVLGLLIGVPVGVAAGRSLWLLFAHQLSAVADPVVPVLSLVVVALSTLLAANLIATLPGLIAARTPTALLLRSE